MKKDISIFIMAASLLFVACSPEVADHSNINQKEGSGFSFTTNKNKYQQVLVNKSTNRNGVQFIINEASFADSSDSILKITAAHPRNCNGQFEFIWDGSVAFSFPPQIYIIMKYDGTCTDNLHSETTTLLLDLDKFIGESNLQGNPIVHVINGSVRDSSNDKNVSSN